MKKTRMITWRVKTMMRKKIKKKMEARSISRVKTTMVLRNWMMRVAKLKLKRKIAMMTIRMKKKERTKRRKRKKRVMKT
jgi:hypothetical protein